MADLEMNVVGAEADADADEDDELLKEYGEDGLEDDDDGPMEGVISGSGTSSASKDTYKAGPRVPLPRSKNRPGDKADTNFMNLKIMMVLFAIFLVSAIAAIAFKEDLFFSAEENTAIESDEIKINGLKETLKWNENKISQLTMTMEDKETELVRLTALFKKKKGHRN